MLHALFPISLSEPVALFPFLFFFIKPCDVADDVVFGRGRVVRLTTAELLLTAAATAAAVRLPRGDLLSLYYQQCLVSCLCTLAPVCLPFGLSRPAGRSEHGPACS